MRRPLIAGNWKMYKTISEGLALARAILYAVKDIDDRDILLCPPYTCINPIYEIVKDSNVMVGAQNMHWENEGAYTGAISPVMLKDAGCKFVIIGHSERRQYFNETDWTVNLKLKKAIEHNLIPIMCVGEKLEERERGDAEKVVQSQLENGLKDIQIDSSEKIVIAYEPVWAIGTGRTATPEDANSMHKFIRGLLKKLFGENNAENIRILYGGSVKPENIDSLMAEEQIDGVLVGGASLIKDAFIRIIKFQSNN